MTRKITKGLQTARINKTYEIFIYNINRLSNMVTRHKKKMGRVTVKATVINPYLTAFPYGNGMVLHFYQQQESSTTKTVHRVINRGLKTYV
jgi:hypothetical protein